MKLLLASSVAFFALLAPTAAFGGLASITFRDLPLNGERTLASSQGRFDLVGARWRGPGTVAFSVRSAAGRWSAWTSAEPEDDDQPDRGSREPGAGGWHLGSPTWVGPSTGFRYRLTGRVTALRAAFVRSPEVRIPLRATASAGAPAIVPRSAWGADESIRRNAPQYGSPVRLAIVHHTAGPNDYSPSQAAAIVRGIQLYHVKSNGWNDIGYNFLVDRFGTVYEGRYGGIDRDVVGAHARGFNTGSVGVAVIGTFETAKLPAAAETALAKVLAWRLDLAHVDPLATLTFVSGGSERFPAGIPVFLRAVSAHRDTGLTACPGDLLYGVLGRIAAQTQAIGLPKLYEAKVTGGLGAPVRVQARVSAALPWRVSFTDSTGRELAVGEGAGPTVDWTWDTLAPPAGVRWSITVPGATPAEGTLGPAAPAGPLAITGLAADPETISPNDDGQAESAKITYTTTAPATVGATLLDAAGVQIAELRPQTVQSAGQHTFAFDGLGQPDGVYTVVVTALDTAGVALTQQATITVTRTLGQAALAPAVLTPNGDGRSDALRITFQLAAPATVKVRVLRDGAWVATPFSGALQAGAQVIGWDGKKRVGKALDGSYTAVVEAADAVGTATITLPFVTDARAPVVRLLGGPPRLWVSEPASLSVTVNGSVRRLVAKQAGVVALARVKRVRTLVVVARDAAGNRSVLRRPV